jgi:HSP20 family protein
MAHKEMIARENEVATYDPFRELRGLGAFSEMFEDLLGGLPALRFSTAPRAWTPRCDIKETDKDYVISAALPGVRKDDVKLTIENGMLTLSGERKEDKEEKGKGFLRHEIMSGTFMRSFSLPAGMHPEDIKAKFADGVLTVTLPKPAELRSRGVPIKVD